MNLKNMTKSAEGTVKDPGRNLKQKSGLNRSLARVAPYGMRMAIQWALFKADGRLILVDPKYTSQTRPRCGYTSSTNRPAQAHFGCQLCGCTENADVAGALNVLKKSRTGSVRPWQQVSGRNRPFLRVLTRIRGNPGIHTRKDVKKKVLRRVPFG